MDPGLIVVIVLLIPAILLAIALSYRPKYTRRIREEDE